MPPRFKLIIEEKEPEVDWDYYSGPEDKGFMPSPPQLYGLQDLVVTKHGLIVLSAYSPPHLFGDGPIEGWPQYESPKLFSVEGKRLVALRRHYGANEICNWIVGDLSKHKFEVVSLDDRRIKSPSSIASDLDRDRAYLADDETGELLCFDLKSRALSVVASGLSAPSGLSRLKDRLWFHESSQITSIGLGAGDARRHPYPKQLTPRSLAIYKDMILLLALDGLTLLSLNPKTGEYRELPWAQELGRGLSRIASDGKSLFAIAKSGIAIFELAG